jgi:dienelactone hydrolase
MSLGTGTLRLFALLLVLVAPRVLAAPPVVRITNAVPQAGGYRLDWSASRPDMHFVVESRRDLASGDWAPVPFVGFPVSGRTLTVPAEFLPDHGFFRVRGIPDPSERGKILSATLVRSISTFELQLVLSLQGINTLSARNAVRFYKVVYETIDPHGFRTQASGAMMIPDGVTGPRPMVSYLHGTITAREDVPSRLNTEGYLGAILASQGYVAVLPDYLGLGDSPGFHPYHHAGSEASTTIDLLRAARTWTSSNSVALSGRLFLTGYSQGGHATLAAMRELEANHSAEFPITAVAGGAGAYDLAGVTTEELLKDQPSPNPYYFAYILAAYIDVYGIAGSLSEVLAQPYATTVPPLFANGSPSALLNAALPSVAQRAVRTEFLQDFRSRADHPLRVALRENSLTEWTPRAPLRLYHCSGDLDVPPANAVVAFDRFRALGATRVERFDPQPSADHGGCVEPTLLAALAWFETLR